MDVKPGYKQTDAGVIPEDWEVSTLGQLGAWKGGGTPSMRNPAFWTDEGIPWISSGEVKSSTIADASLHITEEAISGSSTTTLPIGSIIVVVRSGILRKYLPVAQNTNPVAINQDIKGLVPFPNIVALYLLHLLRWSGPKILATSLKSGTTVESVEFQWLKAFPVSLPSTTTEQAAIARALSDADAYIESLEQLLAKKRLIKQGAMQELLTGKRRLSGFNSRWSEKRLGDVGDFLRGSGLSKSKLEYDGRYPCILYGELFTTYTQKIKKVVSRTNSREGLPAISGDVLMPASTTTVGIDLATASAIHQDKVLLGGDIIVIRKKHPAAFDSDFLANYLTYVSKNKIAELAQGITIIHMHGSRLKELTICVPSDIDEQVSISHLLSDMDAEIEALESKLKKAQRLKQGMMQELLTGRIRLI